MLICVQAVAIRGTLAVSHRLPEWSAHRAKTQAEVEPKKRPPLVLPFPSLIQPRPSMKPQLPALVITSAAAFFYFDLYRSYSTSLPALSTPFTWRPAPEYQMELPLTLNDLTILYASAPLQPNGSLASALDRSTTLSLCAALHMVAVTFLLHRLHFTPKSSAAGRARLLRATKLVMMLCVGFFAMSWQRQAFYMAIHKAVQEVGAANSSMPTKTTFMCHLLIVFSRIRWLCFALALLFTARSYQVYVRRAKSRAVRPTC